MTTTTDEAAPPLPAYLAKRQTPCEHFTEGQGECGQTPTREYLTGHKCAWHTPAALAGRPEVVPDPTLTLDALRALPHPGATPQSED